MRIHVWIGTSRIAGKGLFAAQNIHKGTRIIQYIGQRIAKAEPLNAYIKAISISLPSMIAMILTVRP
jgi:hypothetical protein